MSGSISQDLGLIFESADAPEAAEARRAMAEYRILLDWSEELGFTATCLELRGVSARAADADDCVAALLDSGTAFVASLIRQGGQAPAPIHHRTRRPQQPAQPLPGRTSRQKHHRAPQGEAPVPPSVGQVLRMARWAANEYRIVLHVAEGSYYGTCPEIPSASGFGPTASACVADIRAYLTALVGEMLAKNQMPPEPMQEIERRRHAKRAA